MASQQSGTSVEAASTVATTGTWYEEFYGALEAKDATAVKLLMTPDTSLRLGNRPPVEGRDEVLKASQHFWGLITSMRHSFETVIDDGDTTFFESFVEYTRLDGSTVTIPAATAIVRRDGLVAAQRIYVDAAPLFDAS